MRQDVSRGEISVAGRMGTKIWTVTGYHVLLLGSGDAALPWGHHPNRGPWPCPGVADE